MSVHALEAVKLRKVYPDFTLDGVSFSVEEGQIAGLVGPNGAGKSTTLKSVMGLISSEGTVRVFGKSFFADDGDSKQLIGYVGGGFRFYPNKSLSAVAKAVSRFYPNWDGEAFRRRCEEYGLAATKKVHELSEGMKVKFSLAIALSHGARLLILDEPTSGLDPVSREDFCDALLSLKASGAAVLFSTHITSDLMRAADKIIYLSGGRILADEPLDKLLKRYRLKKFGCLADAQAERAFGIKAVKGGYEGLVTDGSMGREATLDEIMIHLELAKEETE